MKKSMIYLSAMILGTGISFIANASGKHQREVSWFSEQSFAEQYGSAGEVTWRASPQFDEAGFVTNGSKYTAFYTPEGEWVGTLHDISYNDLPQPGKNYIARHYSNAKVLRILEYVDNSENEIPVFAGLESLDNNDNFFVVMSDVQRHEPFLLKVTDSGAVSFFRQLPDDVLINK